MTLLDGVTLRPAVAGDADGLAKLQVDVWEDAYSNLMPAAVFEERRTLIDERVDRWRQILKGARHRGRPSQRARAGSSGSPASARRG